MNAGAPEKLWEPPVELAERSRMRAYMGWLAAERGHEFAGYDELWRWSVDHLDGFWSSIWDYFDVQADGEASPVLAVGSTVIDATPTGVLHEPPGTFLVTATAVASLVCATWKVA